MSIFRKAVPNEWLFELLEKVCLKTDKYYCFDNNSYRIMRFHKYDDEFCEKIMDCYHVSRRFYITRPRTMVSFSNIIRQICKRNKIPITHEVKYLEGSYLLQYFVIHTQDTNAGDLSNNSL
jgi:hypothetical protein